jgi:hypothetical protein
VKDLETQKEIIGFTELYQKYIDLKEPRSNRGIEVFKSQEEVDAEKKAAKAEIKDEVKTLEQVKLSFDKELRVPEGSSGYIGKHDKDAETEYDTEFYKMEENAEARRAAKKVKAEAESKEARSKILSAAMHGDIGAILDDHHHPGGGDWIHNTAFANRRSNFNFLCREPGSFRDVPGFGHVIRNNLGFRSRREVSDLDPTACEMAGNLFGGDDLDSRDFVETDPSRLSGPRQPDGSLPEIPFMRPAPGGRVVDRGVPLDEPFEGPAPDPGAYEAGPRPSRK